MTGPTRKLLKIAGIIAGSVLLTGLATVLAIRSSADRAWEAMQKRTRERLDASRADPGPAPRTVFYGTAEPGNAWTDYDEAMNRVETITWDDTEELRRFAEREPDADRAAVERLLASHGAAVELLRRGAHRADATFRHDWEKDCFITKISLDKARALGALTGARARMAREEGRVLESARILLDLARFAADVRRRGMLIEDRIGAVQLKVPLHELGGLIQSRDLSSPDWVQIGRALEILDLEYPDEPAIFRNDHLVLRCVFLKVPSHGPVDEEVPALLCWRYGFSPRLMVADAIGQCEQFLERRVSAMRGPWLDLVREEEKIRGEVKNSSNWMVRLFSSAISHVPPRFRRAQLRLLRAAIHFRERGHVPSLEDPFGTELRHDASGPMLKIWSVGVDGTDQGGVGAWRDSYDGKDIVLEFPKK